MNKPLSTEELETSIVMVPVLSKHEKLMRFARIVRGIQAPFFIFHGLEYYRQDQLAITCHPSSAFAAAAKDPILQDAGLKGDSALDAMRFFELTQNELHAFSCDCGGLLTNDQMADRIESLAKGGEHRKHGLFGYFR